MRTEMSIRFAEIVAIIQLQLFVRWLFSMFNEIIFAIYYTVYYAVNIARAFIIYQTCTLRSQRLNSLRRIDHSIKEIIPIIPMEFSIRHSSANRFHCLVSSSSFVSDERIPASANDETLIAEQMNSFGRKLHYATCNSRETAGDWLKLKERGSILISIVRLTMKRGWRMYIYNVRYRIVRVVRNRHDFIHDRHTLSSNPSSLSGEAPSVISARASPIRLSHKVARQTSNDCNGPRKQASQISPR